MRMFLTGLEIKGVDDEARDERGRWTSGGSSSIGKDRAAINAAWNKSLSATAAGVALVAAAPVAAALIPPAVGFTIGGAAVGIATSALAEATISAVAEHAIATGVVNCASAVLQEAGIDREHAEGITKMAESIAALGGAGAAAYRAFFKKSSGSAADISTAAELFSEAAETIAKAIVAKVKLDHPKLTPAQEKTLQGGVDDALNKFCDAVDKASAD